MEPSPGLEPGTSAIPTRCSASDELRRRLRDGAGRVDRTPGLALTRSALCHLSYASKMNKRTGAPLSIRFQAGGGSTGARPIWTFTMSNSPTPETLGELSGRLDGCRPLKCADPEGIAGLVSSSSALIGRGRDPLPLSSLVLLLVASYRDTNCSRTNAATRRVVRTTGRRWSYRRQWCATKAWSSSRRARRMTQVDLLFNRNPTSRLRKL
jgi:hypothetical protein